MPDEIESNSAPIQRAHENPTGEIGQLRILIDKIQADNARLTALLSSYRHSALLHANRAAESRHVDDTYFNQFEIIRRSTFWRVTWPMRTIVRLVRGQVTRADIALAVKAAAVAFARMGDTLLSHGKNLVTWSSQPEQAQSSSTCKAADQIYRPPISRPATEILAPGVLIIAELSVPQCAKYRVWQKQAQLQRLGVRCTVTDWRSRWESVSALQLHSLAIFYRVPATPEVIELIEEARRLGVETFWEVDDLIFDEKLYLQNRNLSTLEKPLLQNVLAGVGPYRSAMLACSGAIASTAVLGDVMLKAGVPRTIVVENALDDETLDAATAIRRTRPSGLGRQVVIFYGSGTKTHDIDFTCAASALVKLMRTYPQVRLRIVGELLIPAELEAFGVRVEKLASTNYRHYLELLGETDISIAPLDDSAFNDAKSNIKYLEAAVLDLPSVCSPRASFRSIISHGENGFLAEGESEWLQALARLVDDPPLRQRVGAAAHRQALDRYHADRIGQSQISPMVANLDQRHRGRIRILVVNVFFWPRSFGGATIVAEQLAGCLHGQPDTEVFVFTSHGAPGRPPYSLFRYERGSMPIIGVRIPDDSEPILNFDNPRVGEIFGDVLAAVHPDIVHFHSVQGLSSAITNMCQESRTPYVITVHDAWWLCERQFMVRADDHYCFQTKVDLRVCQACIPDATHLGQRFDIALHALRGAARVLAPSEFQRQLYIANGVVSERVLVNRNGILPPIRRPGVRKTGETLRFGYAGGNERIKGVHLIRQAFESIDVTGYELVIVDNTLNLGFASMDAARWQVGGRVTVIPAYTQDTIDDFFRRIDVLLFPSQWKESFGLTVREALIRDCWVIVSDAGGAVEDVVNGENGTVIPFKDDPTPLRNAILALLRNPDRLAEYHNPHKSRIVTFDHQAEELAGILHRVVVEEKGVAMVPREATAPK